MKPQWLQLIIPATSEQFDPLDELLSEFDAAAITMRDASDTPIIEPAVGTTPLWGAMQITALFPIDADMQPILDALQTFYGQDFQHRLEPLEERVWEREWMESFLPIKFGARLWIVPSWCEPPKPDDVNILLDPGLAFGTGTHPTTALCLNWLDANPPKDKLVIDYGCGSGILALAALKLGAAHVIAIDNDPQALVATQENCVRNNIDLARIDTLLPEQITEVKADLLIANIVANPLIKLASRFAKLTKPEAELLLSGILSEQIPEIHTAYTPMFALAPAVQQENWCRITGKRI